MGAYAQATLSTPQLNALFDILTHTETFTEVRDLRHESAVQHFGLPFTTTATPSPFPLLQLVTGSFVGRSILSEEGWASIVALVQRLCAANLSDSYDKGFVGLRKNAATGLAATAESLVRGVLAGAPRRDGAGLPAESRAYDLRDGAQLEMAWDDAVQGMVYGDLLERVFEAVKTSPDLERVPAVGRGALEYFIIGGATMMHYTTVLLPEGQQLVKMMEIIHELTPYAIMKQTVRMGNVQSMLNGMLKVMLAKVGDKNLVQMMASRTIKLDLKDLEKRAETIRKDKKGKGLAKALYSAIDDYVALPMAAQEQMRLRSLAEGRSMVAVILQAHYPTHPPDEVTHMSADAHTTALAYLSTLLSIRDRQQGVLALCKEKPDLLSPLVKEYMTMLTPLLKSLSDGKFDMGTFITLMKAYTDDFVKTAKITKTYTPAVADFQALLARHVPALWAILHEGARKCPELHAATYGWLRASLGVFRRADGAAADKTGPMGQPLLALFARLSGEEQRDVAAVADAHAAYMAGARARGREVLQAVLERRCAAGDVGPSAVLTRWHALLDGTLVTPAEVLGQATSVRSVNTGAARQRGVGVAPDTEVVVTALGRDFREVVARGSNAFSMGGMVGDLPRVDEEKGFVTQDGFGRQGAGVPVGMF